MQRNRLAEETSPYLQQHADNPVDWYPWGEMALARAKRENKPILLSIGYSACHWCHVMAHESFEDQRTAALMNELFVNIKVDREERPDLDRIYQIAQQMITHGSGGWPLTMFLSPHDQQPFFGGTYFPKEPRFGLPAFTEISAARGRISSQPRRRDRGADRTSQSCIRGTGAAAGARRRFSIQRRCCGRARRWGGRLIREFGGFTQAPKFPHPGSIERCLRQWRATAAGAEPDLEALAMAALTLTRMAQGGIYDQLGGGFARYSVDGSWTIPHFEKMLYDNAQLLCEYARASLATGEALFARIAAETADWVLRDMRSPEGGFYSSLDADSDGHEGRFYVWNPTEVQSLLTAEEYRCSPGDSDWTARRISKARGICTWWPRATRLPRRCMNPRQASMH